MDIYVLLGQVACLFEKVHSLSSKKVQYNILLDNLRVLDLVRMSRSHVKGHRRGGVCVLRMLLVFYTSTKSWRGYIFIEVCLCVCVCVCVSVCPEFLWTKFQPNGCTDLDAVFAKWLLTAMARTQLKLVTLGQRSRSQSRNTHFFFILLC